MISRTNRNCGSGPGPDPVETVQFLATENISAYDVVTSTGVRADNSNQAHRNIIIGFATTSVLAGFYGTVIGFGQIQNPAWTWSAGDKIFLNGLGTVANSAPSSDFVAMLGTATNSITIDVNIQPSILL